MLKDVPADILKIDREFLMKSNDNDRAKVVLADMITLAKHLSMTVVTEGVETKEQVELLTDLGCDIAQGYYYAKPILVSEFESLLE